MTEQPAAAPAEEQEVKLGFIYLAPGISKANAYTFFYAAFMVIGLLTFVSTGTAQVLNALGVPLNEQGGVTGNLVIVTEIVQIAIFGVAGVAADRIGRREVASVGIAIMGLGYLLYPYASSVPELLVYRGIYALGLGLSTGMVGTLIADYSSDASRGKFVAVGGIFNGLGVICITVIFGARAAPMLVEAGFEPLEATRITHIVVACTCFVSAIVFYLGLKPGTPGTKEERPPVKELIRSGFTEAVKNKRIALAYACGFVARSDQVILGTFTVLWGTTVGVSQGMDYATAAGKGAIIFAMAGSSSLLWLPILGAFTDKMNKVSAVILSMSIAAVGYGGMYFIDEATMFTESGFPLSMRTLLLSLLLGVGQISAFLAATILISQEAPKLKRGAVVGMFNTSGAIGIFIAVAVGGQLFDIVGGWGPFMLIAVLNFVVVLMAIVVRFKWPGPPPGERGETIVAH